MKRFFPEKRRGDAIVLTGGATRGAAQVGMLRALTEHGVTPRVLAGTSVGSLNAAWFAKNPTLEGVEGLAEIWRGELAGSVFRIGSLDLVAGLWKKPHALAPDALHRLIDLLDLTDLTQTQIPLRVVTTRVDNGTAVMHHAGSAREILAASCALPGVFPPLRLSDGVEHMDGGVAALAPVFAVEDLSPKHIFLLDVTGPAVNDPGRTALEMVQIGFRHAMRSQLQQALTAPGVLHIKIPDEVYTSLGPTHPQRSAQLIEAGYLAAREVLASTSYT